jgi:hypothetical protein
MKWGLRNADTNGAGVAREPCKASQREHRGAGFSIRVPSLRVDDLHASGSECLSDLKMVVGH